MLKFLTLALLVQGSAAFAADGLYYGALSASNSKTEFCSYNVSVPQVTPAPGSSARSAQVAKALNAKWQAQLAAAVANFETSTLDPEMCKEYFNSWQINDSFEIASDLDAIIVSIVFTEFSYTGGAHGGSQTTPITFNAKSGEIYANLGAFFEDAKVEALKAKIEEYVKYSVEGELDLSSGFNDWKNKITSPYDIENFYFDQSGLIIFFQEYEIASYSAGRPVARIPWSELKDLGLRTSGPATELKMPTVEAY